MRLEASETIQVFAFGINWGEGKDNGKEKETRISLILGFLIISFYF